MTRHRGGGVDPFHSSKGAPKAKGSDKERHRAAVHGRAQQTMGSGGRAGGTKASGGRVRGGSHGGYRGGGRGRAGGSGR